MMRIDSNYLFMNGESCIEVYAPIVLCILQAKRCAHKFVDMTN